MEGWIRDKGWDYTLTRSSEDIEYRNLMEAIFTAAASLE